MVKVIKNIAFQGIIILLIVQTMNLSLNSLNFYSSVNTSESVEDLDYVDSMIEYVVENMLGFSKHTFHDKANTNNIAKQQQNNIHFDLKWLPNLVLFSNVNALTHDVVKIVPQNEKIINLYYKEVLAKPPQVLSV